MAVHPSNADAAFVAGGCIGKTTDGGNSWTEVSCPGASSLAIAPSDPTILYSGTGGNGVWRSSDAGTTWGPASTGIEFVSVQDVAVDPSSPLIVYAGTFVQPDVVVTKLNASGTGIVYSTFLGGRQGAYGRGVATDSAGSAFVTGYTWSPDFPVTPGAHMRTMWTSPAFVSRILDFTSACSYSANPPSKFFYPWGGTQLFSVVSPSGCAWTATPDAPWVNLVGVAAGTGIGSVNVSVDANSGAARSASLNIGGTGVSINQAAAGCYYNIFPNNSISVPVSGGLFSASVVAPPGCDWIVENYSPSWITVTSGANGSGNGTVGLSFAPNPNAQSRRGGLTIAGNGIDLWQSGEALDVIDLAVTSLQAPIMGMVGGSLSLTSQVANIRGVPSPAFRVGFYISTDPNITAADRFAGFCNVAGLGPRATTACNAQVTVPPDLAPGKYYLGAIADDLGAVAEGDDANNSRPADTGQTDLTANCVLNVDLSYGGGVLTMNFDLGTIAPATWRTWLIHAGGFAQLWSQNISPFPSVVEFPKTVPVPSIGNVGVLTALTASPAGLLCSDWATVNTSGAGPSVAELEEAVRKNGLGHLLPRP